MPDMNLLRDKIDRVGIPITTLANKCGVTRNSLYNKLDGKSEFKASEICIISAALHLTQQERDAIFFGE